MSKEFVRRDTKRYSKLGKGRKKIQRWRRPTGRDNQMRLKQFGYPKRPTVGHQGEKTKLGLVKGKKPFLVRNINDLESVEKAGIVIVASVGAKKKMEIIKKANEMKLELYNVREAKK